MKNKPLIITLIVILSILTIGVVSLLVLLLNNSTSINKFFSNGFYSTSETIIHDQYYENKYDLIDIKNSLGDIFILNSEDEKIHVVVYGDKNQLTIRDSNNLKIDYKSKPCFGFCFNQPSSKVEIYLPSTYDKEINIENKTGDIKIEDFKEAILIVDSDLGDTDIGTVKSLEITSHAGDIEVNKVNRIKAINNLGDINIDKVNEFLDIKADCGDIKIKYVDIKENSKIENNMGDIKINSTNDIRIDAKVSLGEEKVNNSNYKSDIVLNLENSCGNIEVN